MKCPHCNIPLLMADRKGVEIDYCGQCRGVWLDKGELDKIIELSIDERFPSRSRQTQQPQGGYDNRGHYQQQHHQQSDQGYGGDYYHKRPRDPYYDNRKRHHKYKKRKSLMGEIFDIFD